ncbi:MAG: hypothetical protein MPJ25_10400 [Pirellulales bacterium]|nr:hypothetical protein [Pirellulales bacterium]
MSKELEKKLEHLQHQMESMAKHNHLKSDGNGGWIRQSEASQNTDLVAHDHRLGNLEAKNDQAFLMINRGIWIFASAVISFAVGYGVMMGNVKTNSITSTENRTELKESIKYNANTFVTKDLYDARKDAVDVEIQDRKDYANQNNKRINELEKKLADDNVEILKQLNEHKH